MKPMTQPLSLAEQIAQAAIAFEEQRLGCQPTSVTVILGGDPLLITMCEALPIAEKALVTDPVRDAQLQELHQRLFHLSTAAEPRESTM